MADFSVVYTKNFKKEDFAAGGRVLTIKGAELADFPGREEGKREKKVRLLFLEDERGVVLNKTRYEDVVAIAGAKDSDRWVGVKVEVFLDPTVRNPNGPRGGIGIRKPTA